MSEIVGIKRRVADLVKNNNTMLTYLSCETFSHRNIYTCTGLLCSSCWTRVSLLTFDGDALGKYDFKKSGAHGVERVIQDCPCPWLHPAI